jgi:gamma-glutamyltranspeptidase
MRKADGTMVHIDAREEAPASANEHMLIVNGAPKSTGGVSVAVPSELKLLDYLFKTYGSKNVSWFELFEPTINFTRDGFALHEYLYNNAARLPDMLRADPVLRGIFFDSNGQLKKLVRVLVKSTRNVQNSFGISDTIIPP